MMKVAAYCRVSTEKEDQANSLASQRSYFTAYIRQQEDWELVEIYYDEGISGTQTAHRKGFQKMILEAVNGRIDLILTKEVSRFARNTVDTLAFTRKLKQVGVGVLFIIDNIDTRDSDGELRLTIMASIAQEESRKTSERVKWGQKRRMEQGVVFGRDLLGYRVEGGKLYINEEEVSIVQAIFHKYTNEGKGTTVIARELMEEGMAPPRTAQWSNTTILKILRNEKYVGDLCQKKTVTLDYLTHEKKYNHGEEEMVYLKKHHEGIISRELWERTQKELKRRAGGQYGIAQANRHNNQYWYSGRLYCGICKSRYVSRTKRRKDGSIYKGFRCGRSAKEGRQKKNSRGEFIGCDNRQISEQTVLVCLAYVLRCIPINKQQLKQEILREIEEARNSFMEKNDGSRISWEIISLQEKKKKAVDLMMEGILTDMELVQQKAWYDEKIRCLHRTLENAEKTEQIKKKQAENGDNYIKEIDKILDLEEKAEFIFKEILDKVVLYKNTSMDIYLKGIPFLVHLVYCSYGKGEDFKTEVLEMKVIGIAG